MKKFYRNNNFWGVAGTPQKVSLFKQIIPAEGVARKFSMSLLVVILEYGKRIIKNILVGYMVHNITIQIK
jgi:hypothetical protein